MIYITSSKWFENNIKINTIVEYKFNKEIDIYEMKFISSNVTIICCACTNIIKKYWNVRII